MHEHAEHRLAEREQIINNIEQFGCHLVLIEETNYLPAFVYSIGLYQKFGHPEIICFGLSTDVMASIINHACDLIQKGTTLKEEQLYYEFLEGYSIQFLNVHDDYYPNYLGYAGWFYNMSFDFPALQLIWPDKQHCFPWESAFNPDWQFKQPLLDRSIDFKFYEDRNLGVYTTRQAFEGDPILFVYHNVDGDWQFHTTDTPDLSNARLVTLDQITKLDPSINDVFNLEYGWHAWRDDLDAEWQYAEDASNGKDSFQA